jgi:TPP-dependent pyruvate/acetoin dehydrogenase alpha subunit
MDESKTSSESRLEVEMSSINNDLYRHRTFEDRVLQLFKSGVLGGTVHLSHGQDAVDLGVIRAFENPLVFGNHRSHGQYLATTGDIHGCIKQIYEGYSQHLFYPDKFMSSGIQGALAPVAVGAATGMKKQGIDRRVLSFVGDGTLTTGVFHEAMCLATVYGAPVTFVLIDNRYSMAKTYPLPLSTPCPQVDFADSLDASRICNEVRQCHLAVEGPLVLKFRVERLVGHSCNDTQMYRPKEELTQEWRDEHDPVERLSLTDEAKQQIEKDVDAIIDGYLQGRD